LLPTSLRVAYAIHFAEAKINIAAWWEACPDAVVMSDPNGTVLFASPQTWTLLGLPASAELIGKSVLDYVVESDRPRLAANIAHVMEVGSRSNTEYTALRADGTTVLGDRFGGFC
jgi:PAS domain S-box-containing protein